MVEGNGERREVRLEVRLRRLEELLHRVRGCHAVGLAVVLDHAQVRTLDDSLVGSGAGGDRDRAASLEGNRLTHPAPDLQHLQAAKLARHELRQRLQHATCMSEISPGVKV